MNKGEDKSLVDWIFAFVLGLHGKVLVGGVVREIGAGVAPVRRKQRIPPCHRAPIPGSSRMDCSEPGCPLHLNSDLFLGEN